MEIQLRQIEIIRWRLKILPQLEKLGLNATWGEHYLADG